MIMQNTRAYETILHEWPMGPSSLAAVAFSETQRRAFRFIYVQQTPRPFDLYNSTSRSNLVAHIKAGDSLVFELPIPSTELFIDYPAYNGSDAEEHKATIILLSDNPFAASHRKDGPRMWTFEGRSSLSLQPFFLNYDLSPPVVANIPMLSNYSIDNQRDATAWASAASTEITGQNVAAVSLFDTGGAPVSFSPITQLPDERCSYSVITSRQSTAITVASNVQLLSWYHTNSSTKRARLLVARLAIQSATVACVLDAELRYLTGVTAPSGGTSLTERKYDQGCSDPEMACIQLPGVAGSVATGPFGTAHWTLGVTGAAPTTNPAPTWNFVNLLLPPSDASRDGAIARAGSAEGAVINITSSATSTVTWSAMMVWTEE